MAVPNSLVSVPYIGGGLRDIHQGIGQPRSGLALPPGARLAVPRLMARKQWHVGDVAWAKVELGEEETLIEGVIMEVESDMLMLVFAVPSGTKMGSDDKTFEVIEDNGKVLVGVARARHSQVREAGGCAGVPRTLLLYSRTLAKAYFLFGGSGELRAAADGNQGTIQ